MIKVIENEPKKITIETAISTPYYISGFFIFFAFILFLGVFLTRKNTLDPIDPTSVIIIAVMFSIGIISLPFGGKKTICLNKGNQLITVSIHTFIRNKTKNYLIGEIQSIHEYVYSSGSKASSRDKIIEYSLEFKNKSKIFLGRKRTFFSTSEIWKRKEIVKPKEILEIASFLNVPFTEKSDLITLGEFFNKISGTSIN